MLRKFFDYQLTLTEEGRPLHRYRPLIEALDTFFYEAPIRTKRSPHIRDAIDLKRWMMIVVYALVPCILMAIWNSGVQKFIYESGNFSLMLDYLRASESFSTYISFCFSEGRCIPILKAGLIAFLPIMFISYAVGGFWEVLFAIIRRHEVSEGFLVTGILFALILPSTIPYWMVVIGVSAGVVIGKEIFGGTGMNILNPALVCRAFLFFAFPTKMTGPVWVGTNPTIIQESVVRMNEQSGNLNSPDGVSQSSALNFFNVSPAIKRIHVDAIGMHWGKEVRTQAIVEKQFRYFQKSQGLSADLQTLAEADLENFLTTPLKEGGLGLSPENYSDAVHFAQLRFSQKGLTDGNFFFGNRIGSMGETSILACLLGALLLLVTRIGSWRTMLAMGIGAYLCALLFEWGSLNLGPYQGAFNPAKFALPAYKHLLLGSLAFGLVFMATDPVSSPGMNGARWLYGLLIGVMVIVIRTINPAFPEGVMLAILFGNVFAPLFDYYALNLFRKKYGRKRAAIY
ncbi:NADH:ubiquinone reductase (Na(+)-transporting) subunit B [Simkania negevensis]|uniref:Na(+)-translocating NADH-quinone reductase subunit B n=1 Tax=Simkania negevensis (strain ATCC VR-1471 / DSM 27360 / Z) TaxID=331113 RepID=F8L6K7_SIMNZ|nr:NADH:ubiquinone reductase (Na(+)-transporting) subunit B [Simkania negevensis]CCB88352.1 Na(+)-translocating NADH-quinone reductase subunit B [Simkania negevensis Z]